MAGDWMKVEVSLPDKPEVWQIAEMLNMDPDAVVGKLIRIWRWFDQQTVDGNAPSVTKKLLDRDVGVTGFMDAMQEVGWLGCSDGVISVPNFDVHNSKSAKNRALTQQRVKRFRNDGSVTSALPEKRREEKRREDIKDSGAEAPAPKKKSSLTDKTFQPEWIDEARKRDKYAALDLDHEAEQFGLYHGSKGTKFADWKLAWWNWLNKALEFSKPKATNEQDARLRKLVEEQERMYS